MSGKRILPYVVCLVFGCIIGGYSDTPLPLLSLLAVTCAFVFLGMEFAVYLLLIALPFSFRYILPSRFEIQTPTEPLLGVLVAVYCVRRILDRVIRSGTGVPAYGAKSENTFPFFAPLCFYILITFLSAINTPDLFGTLKGALRATVYMLFSVIVHAVIQNRTSLKRLFVASFPVRCGCRHLDSYCPHLSHRCLAVDKCVSECAVYKLFRLRCVCCAFLPRLSESSSL